MARRNPRGFTLVELMIVVAIIGVLAVVAGTAYRRYMDSARTSEAFAMLGEIRTKEEAYRAELNTYAGWSSSELSAQSLPVVDGSGTAEPCYKPMPATFTGSWAVWQNLGIRPYKASLQCGYVLRNSGTPGTLGSPLVGTTPTGLWWYAIAICDNDGDSTTNATFTTAFSTTVVSAQNEHK